MTTETTLKYCPFCGSNNIDPEGVASIKREFRMKLKKFSDASPDQIEYRPACDNCSASTDGDWNARAYE